MVAYSFKKQFAQPILAGTKVQTIRARRMGRSRHARPGDTLQLYTGLRTKHVKLLGTAICLSAEHITIDVFGAEVSTGGNVYAILNGLDDFARRDGFEDWQAMRLFWEENHSGVSLFEGTIIQWGGFKAA
jgi:hypothetical protein